MGPSGQGGWELLAVGLRRSEGGEHISAGSPHAWLCRLVWLETSCSPCQPLGVPQLQRCPPFCLCLLLGLIPTGPPHGEGWQGEITQGLQ